jgi:GAF domain-containing protein
MADRALFLRTLSEFARTLVVPYEIGDVLYGLVGRVSEVLGVTGAGVQLEEGDRLRFATGVNETTVQLEKEQERVQEGPCVEAYRMGTVVTASDIDSVEARWPPFGARARSLGILAVAGIPMQLDHRVLGALNVYSSEPRDWSPEDIGTAVVLADMATSYLVNASELAKFKRTNEQLERALQSRIVIEQAKGVVAAERKISVDQAFELLRKHARDRNASLRSVADAVVNLGLRP